MTMSLGIALVTKYIPVQLLAKKGKSNAVLPSNKTVKGTTLLTR